MPEPGPQPGRRDPASYRDPAGFVFRRDGVVYRQVDASFAKDWDAFGTTGLRDRLIDAGILIPHDEVDPDLAAEPPAIAVLRPEPIEFISYPYEWSFSQLKDAALLTLRAQAMAMEAGMSLRDASAYNVQFRRGSPILIDSLSFELATPGAPWLAYRQFCEHFLAPLALMARVDIRLGELLRMNLEGVPLDLAARLAPRSDTVLVRPGTAYPSSRSRPAAACGRRGAHERRRGRGGVGSSLGGRGEGDGQAVAFAPEDAAREPSKHRRWAALAPERHRVGRIRRAHELLGDRDDREGAGGRRGAPGERRVPGLGPRREHRALLPDRGRAGLPRHRVRHRPRGRRARLPRGPRAEGGAHPAAARRPRRSEPGPRLVERRTTLAPRSRGRRCHGVPGARPPPRDRPQRPAADDRGAPRAASRPTRSSSSCRSPMR